MDRQFKVGDKVRWQFLNQSGSGIVLSVDRPESGGIPYEVQTDNRIVAIMFFAENELTAE